MIASRYIAAGALALLSAMPLQAASPLLVRDGGDLLLPPPPDTPVYVYEVTWPDSGMWRKWESGEQAASDLRHDIRPQPFIVESIDEENHKLQVRTTAIGRELLRHAGLTVVGPETGATRETCIDMFVRFTIGASGPPLEEADVYRDRQCPLGEEIAPNRKLIIEGLDKRRHRLFVTASDDPRWGIYETVDENGKFKLLGMGRDEKKTTYVSFSAPPVGDRLTLLKIWQFDHKGKGKVIATIDLTGSVHVHEDGNTSKTKEP